MNESHKNAVAYNNDLNKSTALSFLQILARAGAANAVPGGGLIVDTFYLLRNHAQEYAAQRREARLAEFFDVLLGGRSEISADDDLVCSDFSPDEYHALLASCVQDIEDKKTAVYATLFKNIVLCDTPYQRRQLYIQAARNLFIGDIQYARKVFVSRDHELVGPHQTTLGPKELLETKEPLGRISVAKLAYYGFLTPENDALSRLGFEFVELGAQPEELTADAVGAPVWRKGFVAIVSLELNADDHEPFHDPLETKLISRRMRVATVALDNAQAYLRFSAAIVLVGSAQFSGRYLEALQQFSEKRPVLRIDVNKDGEQQELEGVTTVARRTASKDLPCDKLSRAEHIVSILLGDPD